MIINDGKTPIIHYKRPMTEKGFLRNMNMFMTNVLTVISVQTIKFWNIQQPIEKATKNRKAILSNVWVALIYKNAQRVRIM